MATYSDVRGAVSHLLNIAAREWELEQILGNVPPKPFGDDRAYGLLAYSLATVCFRSPEARTILESMIANKAREIALMEERTKKHGRSRAV